MLSLAYSAALQGKALKKKIGNPSVFHLGAVLFRKGNKNIVTGYNMGVNHAESNCLKKLSCLKTRSKNYELFVIRLTDGHSVISCSRPCSDCIDLLIEYKVSKVWFINESGVVQSERPERMERRYTTKGHSI